MRRQLGMFCLSMMCILSNRNCVGAQELEPRNYSVLPVNFNVAALSYTFSHGNIVTDATAPIKDLVVSTSTIAPAFVHTFGLFKKLARIQVIVPYVFLSGTAKINGVDTSATRSGFADARIRFGVNLIGSPALDPKAYSRFSEQTVLGASIVIATPIGQYLPSKLINLGTNRWGFKPEIGFSRKQGPFYFETYAGVWLFTQNNQYLNTNSLDQSPLFSMQFHVSYLFKSRRWVALNAGLANGGETELNGMGRNDDQNNFRIGGTFSTPIAKRHSLKFTVNTGVSTLRGGDFTTASVIYTYSWFK